MKPGYYNLNTINKVVKVTISEEIPLIFIVDLDGRLLFKLNNFETAKSLLSELDPIDNLFYNKLK